MRQSADPFSAPHPSPPSCNLYHTCTPLVSLPNCSLFLRFCWWPYPRPAPDTPQTPSDNAPTSHCASGVSLPSAPTCAIVLLGSRYPMHPHAQPCFWAIAAQCTHCAFGISLPNAPTSTCAMHPPAQLCYWGIATQCTHLRNCAHCVVDRERRGGSPPARCFQLFVAVLRSKCNEKATGS